jgi:hypothetical protein
MLAGDQIAGRQRVVATICGDLRRPLPINGFRATSTKNMFEIAHPSSCLRCDTTRENSEEAPRKQI